jgi:hypothetical protein
LIFLTPFEIIIFGKIDAWLWFVLCIATEFGVVEPTAKQCATEMWQPLEWPTHKIETVNNARLEAVFVDCQIVEHELVGVQLQKLQSV